jgi:hypothetical protein
MRVQATLVISDYCIHLNLLVWVTVYATMSGDLGHSYVLKFLNAYYSYATPTKALLLGLGLMRPDPYAGGEGVVTCYIH